VAVDFGLSARRAWKMRVNLKDLEDQYFVDPSDGIPYYILNKFSARNIVGETVTVCECLNLNNLTVVNFLNSTEVMPAEMVEPPKFREKDGSVYLSEIACGDRFTVVDKGESILMVTDGESLVHHKKAVCMVTGQEVDLPISTRVRSAE